MRRTRLVFDDDRKRHEEWLERRRIRTAPFSTEWNTAHEERMEIRAPDRAGVYFIEAVGTGFVKIGRSKNIRKRLADLRTTNGAILRLLRYESGGAVEEQTQHKKWAYLRAHGEWFIVSEALAFYMGHTPGAAIARYMEEGGFWWVTAA